jgi:hypothetical protein
VKPTALILAAAAVLLSTVALLQIGTSCTPHQQERALGVLSAVDHGCVIVQGIHGPDGHVQDACVSTDKIRDAVEQILRAAASASASASSAPRVP